jgi:hypothetical protein
MNAASAESFRPDDNIARIAAAYCLDCIDVARANFQMELDGSDASIQRVEQMLGQLHDQLPAAKPSQEQIGAFAKMFGSYVGEVFRLKHGAEWGIVRLGDKEFPGMRSAADGLQFWPWERAYNRIIDGAENNMWHYYAALVENSRDDDPAVT